MADDRSARLDGIDECQEQIDALNQQQNSEIVSLEQRYVDLYRAVYERRAEYISGIPNFWFTAMSNHPDLTSLIDDEDEDCLHYLSKFEVENSGHVSQGYKLKFFFNPNPYFANDVLIKSYHYGNGTCISSSIPIEWKASCPAALRSESVPPNPSMLPSTSAGPSRKRYHQPFKSFFVWYNDHIDPSTDDYAEIFKDDLWKNPIQYYLVPDGEDSAHSISSDSDPDPPENRNEPPVSDTANEDENNDGAGPSGTADRKDSPGPSSDRESSA